MKSNRKCKNSVFRNIYEQPYNEQTRLKLYNSAKGNVDFVQRLGLQRSLAVHSGCVNCICWSDSGEYLLSGSDDQHLVVSHAYTFKMLTDYKTSHRANIFSAKFLPCSDNTNIVSCSGDGIILFTDLMRPTETRNNQFNCHKGTTYEIATVPNEPHTFLSCGEDYSVRCYDLRIKDKCNKDNCDEDILISCQRAVTALSINSVRPYQMAIGCSDSTVRIFDRRMLGTKSAGFSTSGRRPRPFVAFTAPGMEDRSYRITSLGFSPQGDDVLVSYSSEHLYMFNIKDELEVEFEPEINFEELDDEPVKPSSGLPPVRRLRLRGDWSDTGPDARPERDTSTGPDAAQARPTLHATLMQRMTDVLSRMLNDPATRAALSHGGEDDQVHDYAAEDNTNRDRPVEEDSRHSGSLDNDSPVVAVSIQGIYSDSNPGEAESADVEMESSQVRWSPPLTSPTLPAADDTVSLPSFQSSFTSVKPSAPPPLSSPPPPHTSSPPSDTSSPPPHTSSPPPHTSSPPPSTSSHTSPPSSDVPSTSTSTSTSEPSSSASSSSPTQDSLTSLTVQQLNTMRSGFIERHGTEPVVNLTYSDKGSTASRISLSVGDEVNREAVPPPEATPGPSSQPSAVASSFSSQGPLDQVLEGDDDFSMDTDDEIEDPSPLTYSSFKRGQSQRGPHAIEKEMDQAIRNSHNSRSQTAMDDRTKVRRPTVKHKYTGHRNARTMIKEATFWGDDFVLSGSDCGHVFVWERETARLVMLLEADHHVVNCIQPHPFLPVLATSGIDYDVKLWAPIQAEPSFNQEMAEELVKRNEIMLEETKDTITVPASFMIRMLACLNQIRRGARSRNRLHRNDNSSGDASQD